jgi:hypothetical protein
VVGESEMRRVRLLRDKTWRARIIIGCVSIGYRGNCDLEWLHSINVATTSEHDV